MSQDLQNLREPERLPHDNGQVAERLDEIAAELEEQDGNPFRVRAYRRGAEIVRMLDRPVHELLAERGREALTELPGIGDGLAAAIESLAATGHAEALEKLRERSQPEARLATV